MKSNIKWLAACIAAFTIGIYGCDDDKDFSYNGSLDLNLLSIKQAANLWDGAECNVITNLQKSDDKVSNFSYNLNLVFYQNRTVGKDIAVDLKANADSLHKAIAKAPQGGVYEKYAGAELLPEEYYLLSSTEMLLPAGDKQSENVELIVYSAELINLVQQRQSDANFVLPLCITNPSAYAVNNKTNTLMFFFQVKYVPSKTGPEYNPDTEGIAEDHTLENGMVLKFHDEFNGTGTPDSDKWRFEEGFQRNEELQWYSNKNGVCENGALVITGKRERVDNPNYEAGSSDWKKNREYAEYTSSSIISNYRFRKGTMIVRAKIPTESGAWPAIWTTGGSNDSWCWEWPLGGEIDLMEYYYVNGKQSIHANVCWASDTRWSGRWDSYNRPIADFAAKDAEWGNKYHIWRMDWDDDFIRLYLDDELMNETDLSQTNNGTGGLSDWWRGSWRNPFKEAGNGGDDFGQQIFLNLAMGGNGGQPVLSELPLKYYVDYVRVYQ
ncbi:family 16 glycosylhydrolase [Bacteroides sp. 519]|uniref:family 16 glycosylhydrolase n=1 Tax=Bacteroides sp. 519 TaxID=2302937 RepID=UPI0013D8B3F6|nr:family 16 glycosylhydrolase [Bacteroides sp. 519]NDV57360.1 DUF1735 domain-containing protein [Bacteroides sp. 519]